MKTAIEIIDEKIVGWTMAEQSGVYYATSVLDDLREIRKAVEVEHEAIEYHYARQDREEKS